MSAGLVDVNEFDPDLESIRQIKIRTPEHTGIKIELSEQEKLSRVYLQRDVAKMLSKANQSLKARHPELRIVPVSGARPRSIQIKLWQKAKEQNLQKYYAAPFPGSNHNYGAAVDVTLADIYSKKELEMGTAVGEPGPASQPRYHQQFLKSGGLTRLHIKRRRILKEAMKEGGFRPILTEWWHFNAYPKEVIRKKYSIIE